MEDDHVDRPGVEVQQCMKLTGTNRSTELLRSHCSCSSKMNMPSCPDAVAALPLRSGRAAAHAATAPGLYGCQKQPHSQHQIQLLETTCKAWHTCPYGRFGTLARPQAEQERFAKAKQTDTKPCLRMVLPLADLVVMAGFPHPFPFRTRP